MTQSLKRGSPYIPDNSSCFLPCGTKFFFLFAGAVVDRGASDHTCETTRVNLVDFGPPDLDHTCETTRIWWRTTPVATKTRYHGVGGALLRARIYPLILFLYYELLTRTCLSGSSFISSLPFKLPGGFFPSRDPIREAHPSL